MPDVHALNVGGGLAVPEREGEPELDFAKIERGLAAAKRPSLEIWMEPGRYLVAAAGVLLARATQTKEKDGVTYVGLATGMNSLVRPA